MKKHKNIPVFIPHLGCPNNCIFCNQRTISGTADYDKNNVRSIIENALSTIDASSNDVQIAFFGGSFTGIDRDEMLYLLGVGREFVESGKVSSIRLSTRPDYISEEILDILKSYCVKTVELGIQSMSDRVLSVCGRGHTSEDSRKACRMIKSYGFELVGQMMTSLPCSSRADDVMTAKEICAMGADGARIYPTMVFKNTELELLAINGEYRSPSLCESVSVCTDVFEVFIGHGVEVVRIGLAESEGLHDPGGIAYGAYHPAMGELVEGEHYYRLISGMIAERNDGLKGKDLIVYCSPGEISKIAGQKGINRKRLNNEYNVKIKKIIEKSDVLRYNCLIGVL